LVSHLAANAQPGKLGMIQPAHVTAQLVRGGMGVLVHPCVQPTPSMMVLTCGLLYLVMNNMN